MACLRRFGRIHVLVGLKKAAGFGVAPHFNIKAIERHRQFSIDKTLQRPDSGLILRREEHEFKPTPNGLDLVNFGRSLRTPFIHIFMSLLGQARD